MKSLFLWQANRGILDSLLEHLDTAGMAETFVRIVGADEQAVPNLPPESLAWLSEMDIITRLLRRYASLSLQACLFHCSTREKLRPQVMRIFK